MSLGYYPSPSSSLLITPLAFPHTNPFIPQRNATHALASMDLNSRSELQNKKNKKPTISRSPAQKVMVQGEEGVGV